MCSSFSSSSSSTNKRSGSTRDATGLESDAKKRLSSSGPTPAPISSSTSFFGGGLVGHPAPSSVSSSSVPSSSSMVFVPSSDLEDKIADTFQTIFGPDALRDFDQRALDYQAQVLFLLHTMSDYTNQDTFCLGNEEEALFSKGPTRVELQNFLENAEVKAVPFEVMHLAPAIEAEAEKNGVLGSMRTTLNEYKTQPYEYQQNSLPKIGLLTRNKEGEKLSLAETVLQKEYDIISSISLSKLKIFALCVNGQAVGLDSISIDHCDPWSFISDRLLAYNTFLEDAPDEVANYLRKIHKKHFKGFFVRGSTGRHVCSVYLATCLYNDLNNLSYLVCRANSAKNDKPFEEWLADIQKDDFLWTYIRNAIIQNEEPRGNEVLNKERDAFINFVRANRLDTSGFIYRYRKSDASKIGFGMFMRSVLDNIVSPKIILTSNVNQQRSMRLCFRLKNNLNIGFEHVDTVKDISVREELEEQLEKAKQAFEKYVNYLEIGTCTKSMRGMTVNNMRFWLKNAFDSGASFAEELWDPGFDTSDCSETEEKTYPQEVKQFRESQTKIHEIRTKPRQKKYPSSKREAASDK